MGGSAGGRGGKQARGGVKVPAQRRVSVLMRTGSMPLDTDHDKWKSKCRELLRKLERHHALPFLCITSPVAELWPDLAERYLEVIPHPMDIRTLTEMLINEEIRSAQEFVDLAMSMFNNALLYNAEHKYTEGEDALVPNLVDGAKLLREWFKWRALEDLMQGGDELAAALDEDRSRDLQEGRAEKAQGQGWQQRRRERLEEEMADVRARVEDMADVCPLTVEQLRLERRWRALRLEDQRIDYSSAPTSTKAQGPRADYRGDERVAVMRELHHIVERAHKDVQYWFKKPVDTARIPHYLISVAKPVSLEDVRECYNGQDYNTYGELLEDCRRIARNAVVFNTPFAQTSPDSAKILLWERKLREMMEKHVAGALTLDLLQAIEYEKFRKVANRRMRLHSTGGVDVPEVQEEEVVQPELDDEGPQVHSEPEEDLEDALLAAEREEGQMDHMEDSGDEEYKKARQKKQDLEDRLIKEKEERREARATKYLKRQGIAAHSELHFRHYARFIHEEDAEGAEDSAGGSHVHTHMDTPLSPLSPQHSPQYLSPARMEVAPPPRAPRAGVEFDPGWGCFVAADYRSGSQQLRQSRDGQDSDQGSEYSDDPDQPWEKEDGYWGETDGEMSEDDEEEHPGISGVLSGAVPGAGDAPVDRKPRGAFQEVVETPLTLVPNARGPAPPLIPPRRGASHLDPAPRRTRAPSTAVAAMFALTDSD